MPRMDQVPAAGMTALKAFLDEYRATFTRFDLDALAELFAFPLQIVSATDDAPVISVSTRDEWPAVLRGLFGAYRALGIVDAEPLEMEITELAPKVGTVRVHWQLQRDDGSAVYDVTAVYTVVEVEGARRIVAIAHNELPELGAAMGRIQGVS